ncbi:MAG TPA: hypothetical protein VFV98_15935 [Vicinamibacterales bacterium]|nr:hypothetical protein [Vicinamibacterales bacterium]
MHGRILVRESATPAGVLALFHGYAQSAEDALNDIEGVPGLDRWTVVAIQALHPFYTRGGRDAGGDKIVANWMTRQDRDLAIADNVAYIDRVIDAVNPLKTQDPGPKTVCFVGFSQGASMAYRAAMLGRHEPAGIVALAGDIPPEVRASQRRIWPRVLIGVGDGEQWYTAPKLESDVTFLLAAGVTPEVCKFSGKHEWTQEFREQVGRWLGQT